MRSDLSYPFVRRRKCSTYDRFRRRKSELIGRIILYLLHLKYQIRLYEENPLSDTFPGHRLVFLPNGRSACLRLRSGRDSRGGAHPIRANAFGGDADRRQKLKNPFSLDNMQEALVSMFRRDPHSPADGKTTGSILEEAARLWQTSLRPSHLYVKITPDNPEELALLYKSPTLRALKTNILTDRQALGVETDAANDYFEFYGI